MKKVFFAALLFSLFSCQKNETKTSSKPSNLSANEISRDSLEAPKSVLNNLKTNLEDQFKANPDIDMDRTLDKLDKTENESSIKFKTWLQSLKIDNFSEDPKIISSDLMELWRDMVDLEYDNDRNFTRKDFDKKWKNKIDYKYLAWYHYFYNGQDGPDFVKLNASYLGKYGNSYYYKMDIISLDKNYDWPSQSGKIFKVEEVDGNMLITGIFQKGESSVWSKE